MCSIVREMGQRVGEEDDDDDDDEKDLYCVEKYNNNDTQLTQ